MADDEKLDFGDVTSNVQTLSLGDDDAEAKAEAAAKAADAASGDAALQAAAGAAAAVAEDFDAAAAYYRKAIAISNTAEYQVGLGKALQSDEEHKDAKAAFQAAVAADAGNADALFALATYDNQDGKTADALAKFKQVVASKPNHVQALVQAGVILQKQNEHKEAAGLFAKAVEVDGSDEQIRARLAQAYDAAGMDAERDAAREALHKAFAAGQLRDSYKQVGKFCCAQYAAGANFVMAFDYSIPAGDSAVQYAFNVYKQGAIHDANILFTLKVEKAGGNYVMNKVTGSASETVDTYAAEAPAFSAAKAKATEVASA